MNSRKLLWFSRQICSPARFFPLFLLLVAASAGISAEVPEISSAPKVFEPILPGEKLSYTISWSKVFSAGTAVMEVRKEKADGKELLRLVSTARTIGIVDSVYPVRDIVQSIIDPLTLQGVSYLLDQKHGKRVKKRELLFDREREKVTYKADGTQQIFDIPEETQDALSSLYYLRTRKDLEPGKTVVFNVHDSGKNWAVEVHVLAKERLKTPLGEFNTIKVKTYPKYEGVFMHKGEIFIWLTDDSRRVPVLMKSTITIGSIVATLTEMTPGGTAP